MLVAAALGTLSAYQREYGLREQLLLRMELECLARQDALTGLLNRRAFNEHLNMALASARREGLQVALMMIDVDHFKLYNDAYGHAVGDQALQLLAPVFSQLCARPLDQAARTGGEEMALVLYDVAPEHQEDLCRKLLDGVD
jgi:two-component system chemotaxis family response regulator WspR